MSVWPARAIPTAIWCTSDPPSENKYSWTFPGGESYVDASVRAADLVDVLKTWASTRPVVVTHEMFARMFALGRQRQCQDGCCSCGPTTIQGVPNWSTHTPKASEKKVRSSAWVTVPPSLSASKTRLASATSAAS